MRSGADLHPGTGVPLLGWPLVNVHWEQLLQPGDVVSKNSASRPGTCQRGLFRFWARNLLFSSSVRL